MINAVPPRYSSEELNLSTRTQCAVCRTHDDGHSRRWVLCPMLDEKPICYGCCLDFQSLARSLEFEDDPFRDLFDTVSRERNVSVPSLRLRCLEHQQQIVSADL